MNDSHKPETEDSDVVIHNSDDAKDEDYTPSDAENAMDDWTLSRRIRGYLLGSLQWQDNFLGPRREYRDDKGDYENSYVS